MHHVYLEQTFCGNDDDRSVAAFAWLFQLVEQGQQEGGCFTRSCMQIYLGASGTRTARQKSQFPEAATNKKKTPVLGTQIRMFLGLQGSISQRYGSGCGSFPFLIKVLRGLK
jgi:hypothetical protein